MSNKHPPAGSPKSQTQRKKIKTAEIAPDPETSMDIASPEPLPPQDKILQILEKISLDITRIDEKITSLDTKYSAVAERLKESEDRISQLEDKLTAVTSENARIVKTLEGAMSKIYDLENRARRCNIRVFGFPEGCETGKPSEFLEKELPKVLDMPPGSIKIERSHRALNAKPQPGQRPRPFVICLQRYPMKEKILNMARQKQNLKWGVDESRIMIFQDFSKDVADKRQLFKEAKKMARDKNLQYFMSYPASLKIRIGERTHSFSNHLEAEQFIASR